MNIHEYKVIKTIAQATHLDINILGAAVLHNIPYVAVGQQDVISFKQCLYTYARHELGWMGYMPGFETDPWDAINVPSTPVVSGAERHNKSWDGKMWTRNYEALGANEDRRGDEISTLNEKSLMRKLIDKVVGVFS